MIIKGSQRGHGRALAEHLMDARENDHVEVIEMRGFVSGDLAGAVREVELDAAETRCKKPFFHVILNPPAGHTGTEAEFRQAMGLVEAGYPGLENQPRSFVIHEKNGERHAHVWWSRIDTEKCKAVHIPHMRLRLQDISRAMYAAMGIEAPAGFRDRAKTDPLNYDLKTWQQAKRLDEDPRDLKQIIQNAWAASDDRASFEHALAQADLYLARGDRRGFVIVHHSGEAISLTRTGKLSTRDLKARLGEPEQLRTVEEVRGQMKQGQPAASIQQSRATRNRQREELRPLDDERRRMTQAQREARRSLDRRDPGRQRTMDGHLRERGQLQQRIDQTRERHREERQREREQRVPLAAIIRQQLLFDVRANASRADLQNRRLGAEGEQGRGHDRQRLKLERQQDSAYGQQLRTLNAEAGAITTRQRQGKGLRGLAYRVTGKAGRDRDRAGEITASIATIGQRKAEQVQALNAEQQIDRAALAARYVEQSGKLEQRIEQARAEREAEGWIPPEARREATTGHELAPAQAGEIEHPDGIDRQAENSPVEGREARTGETTPGNEQASHAQPEAAPEAQKTETEEERNAAIDAERTAREERDRGYAAEQEQTAQERTPEEREAAIKARLERWQEERDRSNDNDPGRTRTR